MLKGKERFREAGDSAIKACLLGLLYCGGQRLGNGPDPPLEETLLRFEIALVLADQVAHHLAERGDVILGLANLRAARQAELRELGLQRHERNLAGVPNGISTAIECYRRLPGSDEGGVVLRAQRSDFGLAGSLGKRAPRIRDAARLRIQFLRRGQGLEQRFVRRRMEEPREQRIKVRPG